MLYRTDIWQMGRGSKIYRFQTNDPRIARKLHRTNGWILVSTYSNRPIWIFQNCFPTPQDARKKLLSLTGVSKLKKGDASGEFYAETYANTTPEVEREVSQI